MNYKSEVKKFIVSNLMFGDNGNLNDDTSFLQTGIVDSMGILEVISFLEKTYNIKIEPEETVPENLDSLNRISEFLRQKVSPSVKCGTLSMEPTDSPEYQPAASNPILS